MTAEAVLAVWVICVGAVVVAVLTVVMAVLQRHLDRQDTADRAAVENELGPDVARLAEEHR